MFENYEIKVPLRRSINPSICLETPDNESGVYEFVTVKGNVARHYMIRERIKRM